LQANKGYVPVRSVSTLILRTLSKKMDVVRADGFRTVSGPVPFIPMHEFLTGQVTRRPVPGIVLLYHHSVRDGNISAARQKIPIPVDADLPPGDCEAYT